MAQNLCLKPEGTQDCHSLVRHECGTVLDCLRKKCIIKNIFRADQNTLTDGKTEVLIPLVKSAQLQEPWATADVLKFCLHSSLGSCSLENHSLVSLTDIAVPPTKPWLACDFKDWEVSVRGSTWTSSWKRLCPLSLEPRHENVVLFSPELSLSSHLIL